VKCRHVVENLSAYIDKELNASLSEKISAHLSGCDVCREQYEGFSQVDQLLRELPRHSLSADFATQTISTAADMGYSKSSSSLFWLAWLSVIRRLDQLYDLLQPGKMASTKSLEEFADIPSSFIGHTYFKISGC